MELEGNVIRDFQLGEVDAFERVFNAYYKALMNYARTIVLDGDEAEDLVQQVFISVWEKRSSLEVHTSLRALLYKSVHNSCLNLLKRQKVRRVYAKELQLEGEGFVKQEGIMHTELQQKIDAALSLLPEQCGKIFKMSRFEQLKYQEIADQLGLSVKTVENQMGKALKIMRLELKEYLPIILIILSHHYRA